LLSLLLCNSKMTDMLLDVRMDMINETEIVGINYILIGKNMNTLGQIIYFLFTLATAMIGYTIHNSLFWSIVDYFFAPITWVKWLIYHEVNMVIIKQTFSWFFNQ